MHDIIKKISDISDVNFSDFEELFNEDFNKVVDQYQITTLDSDVIFIQKDEDINIIWILLSGQVKGLEEYFTGDLFTFKRFHAPEVFGEMEILAEESKYRSSLTTDTKCEFLTIPVEVYKEIFREKPQYLYKRTQVIIKRVLEERKRMRAYLMMDSMDRVKTYLTQYYEIYSKDGICELKISRQQIAEEICYSVKTVNRVIKRLEEEGLLKIKGQKLVITEPQYKKLYKSVEDFFNY